MACNNKARLPANCWQSRLFLLARHASGQPVPPMTGAARQRPKSPPALAQTERNQIAPGALSADAGRGIIWGVKTGLNHQKKERESPATAWDSCSFYVWYGWFCWCQDDCEWFQIV